MNFSITSKGKPVRREILAEHGKGIGIYYYWMAQTGLTLMDELRWYDQFLRDHIRHAVENRIT